MTISASDQLLRILRESHKIATKAVVMSEDAPLWELAITDGNVTIDATAKNRRVANVKLSDPTGELVPSDLTDLIHPLSGHEVQLYRGAYVPDFKANELCRLGVFKIKDAEIGDSGGGLSVTLKLIDRSLDVQRARATEPIATSGPGQLGVTISDILFDRYPKVKFANDFSQVMPWITAPSGVIDRAQDVWDTMVKWAVNGGMDLKFDADGFCSLQPLPVDNPGAADIVWTFSEMDVNPTVLSLNKTVTSDDTYNHVVAYGQTTDGTTPFWGEAKVTDSRHPLRVDGPMGDIPFFYSSSTFTSSDQCTVVAQALLYKHLGHTEHVRFNSLVNPCLEDGDIVLFEREKSKVNSYYALDKLTIPLVAVRAMECDLREKFVLDSIT